MRQLVILLLSLLIGYSCVREQESHEYPIAPVSLTNVIIDDNFWSERIQTNHEVTIPIAIQKSRETGRIKNFAIAGGLDEGVFNSPYPFDDTDIYKIIEGAAYSLQMFPDKELENTIDSLIYLIGEAQEEDGYLFTNRTIMGEDGHEWIGKVRWEKVDDLSMNFIIWGIFLKLPLRIIRQQGNKRYLI